MKSHYLLLPNLLLAFLRRGVMCQEIDTTRINDTNAGDNRWAKIFSFFSIVRFANAACITSEGYNGTCYTSVECKNLQGTAFGSCASGFGVCCVVTVSSCGSSAQINNTYWTNPGYPNSSYSSPGLCSLNVARNSPDICQLRLNFIEFNIAQPDSTSKTTAGQCLTDIFTVNGQSNPVPPICGFNANQHIYLNMPSNQNIITLNMVLSGTNIARKWNIRVSQISCGTHYTAPDNCLQYFTESTGTITSFNYLNSSVPLVQHLANQDYTICIRTNSGFCGVKYEACPPVGTESTFSISGGGANGASTTSTALTDGKLQGCVTDWLQVPCGSDIVNSAYLSTSTTATLQSCVDKFCGAFFSAIGPDAQTRASTPVYSYTRPFELRFHTDSEEQSATTTNGAVTSSTESSGFCLTYNQQACLAVNYG